MLNDDTEVLETKLESHLPSGISVIICCFNSATRIENTLLHLSRQVLDANAPWELVLVDNASTDNTAVIAKNCWEKLGNKAPLKLVQEPRLGTDHARRTALLNAGFENFVFCDDDNWLETNYLETTLNYLKEHPEVGLIGGESIAVTDSTLPEWFETASGYYAVGKVSEKEKDLTHFGHWGAGLAGRTIPMRNTMPHHIPLLLAGRVGSNTGFGEDGEMCMRMAMQGYRIMYLPALQIKHYLAPQKLTLEYKERLLEGATRPAFIMSTYFRWLHIQSKQKAGKYLLLVKQSLAWITWNVLNRNDEKNRSRDFLFFMTGISGFSNEASRVVQQYGRWLHRNNMY